MGFCMENILTFVVKLLGAFHNFIADIYIMIKLVANGKLFIRRGI